MSKFPMGGSIALKQAEKMERTNAAAQLAIDQERLRREQKTARLKALREERERSMPQPDKVTQPRKSRSSDLSRAVQAAFAPK